MTTASQVLSRFAAGMAYDDIPAPVLRRAKDCLIDTLAACVFGSQMPWSRMVADYASRGAGGPCDILGLQKKTAQAPQAALANGVFAHAFEQDAVREPGMGMHAGATMMPALFAVAQDHGADGRTILRAFVAGTEVVSRIAVASQHSPEKLGFHGPGVTGPYGAAIAAGLLLGLDEEKLVSAMGIAGSLSSGLIAFSKSKKGGMIKRLHLGRAAEAGVLAASLAADGYEGPETVLDGRFGFLQAFCGNYPVEPKALTANLGEEWHTLRISLKRYACHVNAHTPVQSIRELMDENNFAAQDVRHIRIEAHEQIADRHNIPEPTDIMQAQYSVPFCVALALHRDPDDPRSFDESAIVNPEIQATCRQIEIVVQPNRSRKSTRVVVELKDGREVSRDRDKYRGMPETPTSPEQLRQKFMVLTKDLSEKRASLLFERLENLEDQKRFSLD